MDDLNEEFLLAVERGEVERVREFLEPNEFTKLNINCRDPLDRDALVIAIDNKDLDMVKLLLETEIGVNDALLYAIQDNFVEAVELLLDHSSHGGEQHQQIYGNDIHSAQSCFFSCDMTPMMLAAQKNNVEIIKLLLDRKVSPISDPHDPRCGCDCCSRARSSDCLKHSRSRINAYKALSSPGLMALSSPDPLATAFELSAKLEDLAKMEPEYKEDYMRLRAQCQAFATKSPAYTRTSKELEILLNFDGRHDVPHGAGMIPQPLDELAPVARVDTHHEHVQFVQKPDQLGHNTQATVFWPAKGGPRSQLGRLKLAIACKQKAFCAHPNIQELLASMWYENLPGFRRKNVLKQTLQVLCIGLMFPIYSIAYLVAPHSQFGSYIKKPFIKFICHSASYMTFIIVLILASQRVDAFYEWSTVMSLFFSDQSLYNEAHPHQSQHSQPFQQAAHSSGSGSDSGPSDSFNPWRATINNPPTGSYSDDSELNQLAALYRQTMGQAGTGTGTGAGAGAGATSTARGLDSLSKIFVELPASSKKRGTLPSPIESVILVWVLSLIWAELKQLKALGINYYKHDMWNILDSIASGCYIGTIILRIVSYVQSDDKSLEVAREHWHAYDATLLSEGLFATATIFSALKLVYIFSVNPYLGPLQISLGRMIIDIVRFSWIYMLVLFAFACGMNQLLWYYADLERHQCLNVTNYNLAQYYKAKHDLVEANTEAALPQATVATGERPLLAQLGSLLNGTGATNSSSVITPMATNSTTNSTSAANSQVIQQANNTTLLNVTTPIPHLQDIANMSDETLMESAFSASLEDDSSMPPITIDDSCKTWRHFSNVFESSQTLFWANFGLVDLENFDLTGIRQYTRFWALLMFGCYCFINVIVVLNLLIAMMNHSYVKISKRSDIEWKFARTRLWVSYFDNGSTVPPPFNIIPSIKATGYCVSRFMRRVWPGASVGAHFHEAVELPTKSEANYYVVMRSLVGRYLVGEKRKSDRRLTDAKLRRWSKSK